MFNSALVRTRLGQYGAAWLISFVGALIGILAGGGLAHMRLVEVADLILPIAFAGLTLAVLAVLVQTLTAGRETVATRLIVIVLALLLFLPLLWGPVLRRDHGGLDRPCLDRIFRGLRPVPHPDQPDPAPAGGAVVRQSADRHGLDGVPGGGDGGRLSLVLLPGLAARASAARRAGSRSLTGPPPRPYAGLWKTGVHPERASR